jgi:hypothetical protein
MNNPRAVTPGDAAAQFSRILNEWLSPEIIAEINRRNASPEYKGRGCCATHDFCDPNQAMLDAFEFFGIEFDPRLPEDHEFCSTTWEIAQRAGFKPPR